MLSRFDKKGRLKVQELITVAGAKKPDKKLFLSPDGSITKHCADTDGDGKLEMILDFDGDTLRSALIDTDGDGRADEREIYEEGVRVALQTDTNGDHRPDVVQQLAGDEVVRQDEDTNFDGTVDVRFDGETPVPVDGRTEMPPELPELECGTFHSFWSRR